MSRQKIFIFGASGHAKVIIDIVERQGMFDIAFLVDDDPLLKGVELYGHQVIGGKLDLLERRSTVSAGIVAIGSNRARAAVAGWLTDNRFDLVSAIHPSSQIGCDVTVAAGTVIMAGAIVNPGSRIGKNVIINTKSSIDHDCIIGDTVHIAPGATLCGAVTVGEGSFVCAGATIIPNLTIGRNSVVGAGSTLICNVQDESVVAGSPAAPINKSRET